MPDIKSPMMASGSTGATDVAALGILPNGEFCFIMSTVTGKCDLSFEAFEVSQIHKLVKYYFQGKMSSWF